MSPHYSVPLSRPGKCDSNVHGGFAAVNRGADFVEYLVPTARDGSDQACGLLPSFVLAGQHRD